MKELSVVSGTSESTSMMSTPSKIMLIACGSFSPPTPMHFRMFEIARDHFRSMGSHSVIGGIVSPVHDSYGKKDLVHSKHRCAMIKLGLQSSDWVRLSDWECHQNQWSKTRTSLQYHQNYINSIVNSDTHTTANEILPGWLPEGLQKTTTGPVQLKLLCGADLLESFAVPGLWDPSDIEAILGQHGIVVITRSGANPEQFIFNSDILTKYKRNITIITNWVSNEVSSSMVRRLLGRCESVKYLIDDFIIEYIKHNELYGTRNSKYILTPNQNEMVLDNNKSPSSDCDDGMDETDYTLHKNLIDYVSIRPTVFCCGGTSADGPTAGFRSLLSHPGQAKKVVHASEQATEVGPTNKSTIATALAQSTAELQAQMAPQIRGSDTIDDVIKFVITNRGLRVISSQEWIV